MRTIEIKRLIYNFCIPFIFASMFCVIFFGVELQHMLFYVAGMGMTTLFCAIESKKL